MGKADKYLCELKDELDYYTDKYDTFPLKSDFNPYYRLMVAANCRYKAAYRMYTLCKGDE